MAKKQSPKAAATKATPKKDSKSASKKDGSTVGKVAGKKSAAMRGTEPKPKAAKKTASKTTVRRAVTAELVDPDTEMTTDSASDEGRFAPTESEIANSNVQIVDDDLEQNPEIKSMLPVARPSAGALTTRDPLALYLAEIRKYPLLTKEQELELAKRYFETKDPESAQKLVKANLRFVVKVAAEYSKFGAKMIDLIQEGNVGLMHAVKDFNPYKGARLITYAVWWIRGYIQEFLMRQYSLVRIGTTQNQRKLYYQLQKEREALDNLGKSPDLKVIADRLGIPEDEVQMMAQRMSGRDVSLDRPVDDDSGATLGSLQGNFEELPLDEALARDEQIAILKSKIEEIRPSLNDREIILLEERLLNDSPLTLQEIGEKYGITREAVRQAEVRLMKKIKDKMEQG